MTEKIDFLISPAYSVPPISTTRFLNEMTIKVSEFVPSSSGFALQVGADRTVNSDLWFFNSALSGVINNWRENRLCQAYSLITSTGRRNFSSAPANPLKENNSFFSSRWEIIFPYSFSKDASSIGWFTAPQSTTSSDTSSRTIKRSLGERPVYLPVVA